MAKYVDFISSIDMHGKEIKNVLVDNVPAIPVTATEAQKGQIVYVTDVDTAGYYYCTGAAWTKITDEVARKKLDERLKAVETSVGIGSGSGESLKTKVDALDAEVFGVEAAEGVEGKAALRTLITTNASEISTVKATVSDHTTKISSNSEAIKTLQGKIGDVVYSGDSISAAVKALQDTDATHTSDISTLKTEVEDPSTGLLTKVSALQSKVGDDSNGLVKDVADLKTTVGTDASGLVKDVADLKRDALLDSDVISSITDARIDKIPNEKAVADYITTTVTGVYKFAGTVPTYASLDAVGTAKPKVNGAVYNVTAAFEFDGKQYNAGTNVVYDEGSDRWEPLTGILDTSKFQLTTNLVNTLAGNESDKYPSVATVKSAVDAKADAVTTYSKTEVNNALGNKVDKLETHPTAGAGTNATFAKVTVNYEGQVIAGEAQITENDISGTIASTKIADFIAKVREANRVVVDVPSLSEDGTTVNHTLNVAYPHVTIYDANNYLVYAAVEYVSATQIKIYGTSTTAVKVIISA